MSTKNYTCIIVDDEKLAQELLENYIQKIPYLELVASCSTALDAMQILNQQKIDILFCDIQMPDLTGINFLKTLKKSPATILTTAYSEYAMEGYELDIVDYLLKPIEFERFFKAVNKAVERLPQNKNIPLPNIDVVESNSINNYFFVKSDGNIVRIDFDSILFIEALQKYIRIYTTNKKIITLMSLSKIEELLPENSFIRIHRSYMINIDKIEMVEGNMVHINENKLPISKGQKEAFMEVLKGKGLYL